MGPCCWREVEALPENQQVHFPEPALRENWGLQASCGAVLAHVGLLSGSQVESADCLTDSPDALLAFPLWS